MTEHEHNENPDDLLTAGEAAAYLARKWNRPGYTTVAFRQLRHRRGLKPAMLLPRESLWRRADLDAIAEPSPHSPRPGRRRRKMPDEDVDKEASSMLCFV